MLSVVPLAAVAAVLGYYAYAKLTYPAYSCGSFAQPDGEIGWVMAPSAASCIGGRDLSGKTEGFRATVFTDANGFRSAQPGTETRPDGILFVGDSWTFGFGVDYEDSFPGRFEALTGQPVVTAASPAYSSAQALLLGERWVARLRPRALVYLDNGFWNRAACSGPRRPESILKPCYWQPAPGAEAELVLPPPGRVEGAARWGNLPGGVLGVGELGWGYFLVSRPLAQIQQLLVRAGLASGFGHDFRAVGVNERAIRLATLRHLGRLAEKGGVPLVLVDPAGYYGELMASLPSGQAALIRLVTAERWTQAVDSPARTLPPDQARVPGDGHYGPGMNHLIARLLAEELRAAGVLP